MENRESLEIRSADTSRKFQWMCILAKEPEISQIAFELSELDTEEKKMICKVISNLIDSVQLYSIAKERSVRKSIRSTIDRTIKEDPIHKPESPITVFDI